MNNEQYRLGTFSIAGCEPFGGILFADGKVLSLRAAEAAVGRSPGLGGAQTLEALLERWDSNSDVLDAIVRAVATDPQAYPLVPLEQLEICTPIRPRNLICAGMNYRKHVLDFFEDEEERAGWAERLDHRAREGLSFMFSKPVGAITKADTTIIIPEGVEMLDWEIELVAVIGREAWRVDRSEALDYVAGYTVGNDISARDLMPRDDIQPGLHDFFGGKSGPGFNPLGPFILPSRFAPDPQKLHLTLRLNGKVMQDESAEDMIDTVAKLIEFASSRTVLYPGDLISTGSPSGNAKLHNRYLQDGDVIEGEIPEIGRQVLRIQKEVRSIVSAAKAI